MQEWYQVKQIDRIDTPALLVYPERIEENIRLVKEIAGGVSILRPHVKTHKMDEVCRMMLSAGITKFKCATISEAEMLAISGAPDILLAYQPVGPKLSRLIDLMETYPESLFSCLVDHPENAFQLSQEAQKRGVVIRIFIDLNVGMNRTGILPENAPEFIRKIREFSALRIAGLHGYDGYIHNEDPIERQKNSDISFTAAENVFREIQPWFDYPLVIVMGGTPTFPMYIHRPHSEVSPGAFVFWDWGYSHLLADLPFQYAALVVSRVISVIDNQRICIDLGHKSVAAENPLPRVHFLNAPDVIPIAQSEEHLVLQVPDKGAYPVGSVLYGVPVHICPTVALYDKAYVIRAHEVQGT
ncbi:MAG: D-TA family PLP-dependent enzyme [Tannerellaceae bacterium]|nr:D-TA family PLP-dependent enzyme [Tannerellaceae bacterium]